MPKKSRNREFVEGGKRLSGVLKVKRLEVQDLVSGCGFNEVTVRAWLMGWRRPGHALAEKLAAFIDLPAGYILCFRTPQLDKFGDNYQQVAAHASLDLFLELESSSIPTEDRRLYEQIVTSAVAPCSVNDWRLLMTDVVNAARRFELDRTASIETMARRPTKS